jgi:hypothetical protein
VSNTMSSVSHFTSATATALTPNFSLGILDDHGSGSGPTPHHHVSTESAGGVGDWGEGNHRRGAQRV